jgi:phosphatidylinositol alpha 1,6-mannosyltransferase
MSASPRAALFADSFHEVNGAALTCRQLEAFAKRQSYEFLSVHCGPRPFFEKAALLWTLQLQRSKLAIPVDRDLSFDPLLFRRRHQVLAIVRDFRPSVIHITSPGDVGILGAWVAHVAGIPLVASWHTNLHEFAARRLSGILPLPKGLRSRIAGAAERWILNRVLWYYGRADATLAPNRELVEMLTRSSGKPSTLMTRGIDASLFSPARRDRTGGPFTLGFVGRLTPEKNVRFLAKLGQSLAEAGAPPFRFLVVGNGGEEEWLKARLRDAELTGVLTGEALARAYANMDLFVFPSQTDTFGNVILEAMASGVPAVVTAAGGPKYLVKPGVTGFAAANDQEFVDSVLQVMRDPQLLANMKVAARKSVRHYSWDEVFESEVYEVYRSFNTEPHQAGPLASPPGGLNIAPDPLRYKDIST